MICHGLIVAAGRGARFGASLPKQYHALNGMPVLRHTILAVQANPRIKSIRVAIHPDDRTLYDACVQGLDILPPIEGGASRQESVLNLLAATDADENDIVLIHDAARPFISTALIDRLLAALETSSGAIAALPVSDTLKRAENGQITATLDRSGMWRAQTPQGFRFGSILAAHRAAAGGALTDDAAVFEHAGNPVAVVLGDYDNFKITTMADLVSASRIAAPQRMEFRTGSGFDVHRFEPGDGCWINGILVPHNAKLLGHSDADVGLHALTDAILGAIGAGDIGSHFPPSDEKWRGAASDRFLRHAADLVTAKGGSVTHCDVTIICERPKIGPHRTAMTRRIAEILEIVEDRVSVKATTSEGLGFTGRSEGIAAQAVATIQLPV